jgi:hypothetical protein
VLYGSQYSDVRSSWRARGAVDKRHDTNNPRVLRSLRTTCRGVVVRITPASKLFSTGAISSRCAFYSIPTPDSTQQDLVYSTQQSPAQDDDES